MKTRPKTSVQSLDFDDIVIRNVEAVTRIEKAAHLSRTKADIVSDAIAGFCGSTLFIWVHCVVFTVWLVWNTAHFFPRAMRFDPPPFNMLTLVVSLEAIFLSTFILISQNRQQQLADQRNHLDLQINLLAEQETSLMLTMMRQVMDHLGIKTEDGQAETLQQETDPERVAEHIQENLVIEEDPGSN